MTRNKDTCSGMACALLVGISPCTFASDMDEDSIGIPVAMQCNGCTEAQVLNKAQTGGQGSRYYYDLVANVMHHVVTECEPAGGGGVVCDAYEDAVPAAIASTFATYHGLWLQNASSETFNQQVAYSVPSGNPVGPGNKPIDNGYVNAFDTVIATPFDDDLVAYLNSPGHYTGFYAALLLLVEPLGNPIIQFDKLTIVVVVVFNDHSKRTYTFDKGTRSFIAVKGSARDANGNDVPEGPPSMGHIFLFNRDQARTTTMKGTSPRYCR